MVGPKAGAGVRFPLVFLHEFAGCFGPLSHRLWLPLVAWQSGSPGRPRSPLEADPAILMWFLRCVLL
jgi:hypothetical protein